MVVCAGWMMAVPVLAALPARADFLFANPTDQANRQTSGTPPVTTLSTGLPSMLDVNVGNPTQISVDSDIEFDIEGPATIPHGVRITSAILSLTIAGAQTVAGPASVSVNGYADGDGVVGLGDFLKPTTLLGSTGNLADGSPGSLNVPFTFDVTGFLQSLVNNKTPFVGFHLEGPAAASNAFIWDGGAPNPAALPSLAITFSAAAAVPEPASALLTTLGLVGVAVLASCRFRSATD
jgi:hypothetical protein